MFAPHEREVIQSWSKTIYLYFRRPSGVPEQDSRCYVTALKQEKLKYLRSKLENLEAQNKLLQAKVERKEACLFQTKDKIVALAEDFEQVGTANDKLLLT